MPVLFASFQNHLKHEILKKMSFKDYTLLIQSSKNAISKAHLQTLKFPHKISQESEINVNADGEVFLLANNVYKTQRREMRMWTISLKTLYGIPIRIIAERLNVMGPSDFTRLCQEVTNQIVAVKVTVKHIKCNIKDEEPCEPEVLSRLINTCKATKISLCYVGNNTVTDYIYLPALKGKELQIDTPLSFSDIRRLKVYALVMNSSELKPTEVNLFLKNPNMRLLSFSHKGNFEEKDDSAILKDLQSFVFWTSQTHFASCFFLLDWDVDGARAYMIEPRLLTLEPTKTAEMYYTTVYIDHHRCHIRFSTCRDFLLSQFAICIKNFAMEYGYDSEYVVSDDEDDDE